MVGVVTVPLFEYRLAVYSAEHSAKHKLIQNEGSLRGREELNRQGRGRAHVWGASHGGMSTEQYLAMHILTRDQESTGNRYIKNYKFTFDFGQPWGRCNVTMTCVSGHLTELTFPSEYNSDWKYPPPDRLFNAPVSVSIPEVRLLESRLGSDGR